MQQIWRFYVNFYNQKSTSYFVLKYMSLTCITCYFARGACYDHTQTNNHLFHLAQTSTNSKKGPIRINLNLYPLTETTLSKKTLQPIQSNDLTSLNSFVFPIQTPKKEQNKITTILQEYTNLHKLAKQTTPEQIEYIEQIYQQLDKSKANNTEEPIKKISILQKQLIKSLPLSQMPLAQHLKVLSLCTTLAVTDEVREKILKVLLRHPHKTNLFSPLARIIFISANSSILKQIILKELALAPESTRKTFLNRQLFSIVQAIDKETYTTLEITLLDQLSNKEKLKIILSSLAYAPIKSTFWDLELEKTDQQEADSLKRIGTSLEKLINNYDQKNISNDLMLILQDLNNNKDTAPFFKIKKLCQYCLPLPKTMMQNIFLDYLNKSIQALCLYKIQ